MPFSTSQIMILGLGAAAILAVVYLFPPAPRPEQ
jgi:hypothetical protein